MHQSIDGRCCCHRVLEDSIPFAEHKITGDQDGSPLVTLCKQSEQHFYFVWPLLHIAKIIKNEQLVVVELLEGLATCNLSSPQADPGRACKLE